MSLSGAFGIFPKRGFVAPADSGKSGYAAAYEPVHLVLDAMISEVPEYTATPTQSQVETGGTISDHVTQKPLKLMVQGIVTDTPIGYGREFTSAFSGSLPSTKAFTFLEDLYLSRQPFDFVGGFRTYRSMVITHFSPTRNAETGDALRFTCTMEQVTIVSSVTLLQVKSAQPKTSHGSQPTAAATPVQQEALPKLMTFSDTFSAGATLTNLSTLFGPL